MSNEFDTQRGTSGSHQLVVREVLQQHLVLVLDRARPLAGSARHSLANVERVTIGRGSSRTAKRLVLDGKPTLAISLVDTRVSSSHLSLEREGNAWILRDLGSTNGSRHNGSYVDTARLSDGDLIECGQTVFRYRAALPTPVNAVGDVDDADFRQLQRAFCTLQPRLVQQLRELTPVAASDVPVLLLGETGTGKEVLARAIHAESGRDGPFVAVNCGALPKPLVESLLFGHRRGAFSGAMEDQIGFVRAAQGGTLFLDEIGDLAPSSQAALLRVLQEREVVPVGATRPVSTDIRVIAATHRPLDQLIECGQFRSDLFARIAAFSFTLPPLRERLDDIGLLVAAILPRIAEDRAPQLTFTATAVQALLASRWPYNVRELEQRLKVAVLAATDGRIDILPRPEAGTGGGAGRTVRKLTLDQQALCADLEAKLALHDGNVTRVAEAMGCARSQVQRWLRRFQIDARNFRT